MTIYVWHIKIIVGADIETVNVEAIDYAQAVDIATAGGRYPLVSCICTGQAV